MVANSEQEESDGGDDSVEDAAEDIVTEEVTNQDNDSLHSDPSRNIFSASWIPTKMWMARKTSSWSVGSEKGGVYAVSLLPLVGPQGGRPGGVQLPHPGALPHRGQVKNL